MMIKVVPFPTSHLCKDQVVWASSPLGAFEPRNAYNIVPVDMEN